MTPGLTYENWNEEKAEAVLQACPDEMAILKWAFKEYGEEIVYACSFGTESMVLVDLISKAEKTAKIVFLDTGLHFPETYALIEEVKERYPGLRIQMVKPELTLEEQSEKHGEELWKSTPNLCCHIRKVLPLQNALQGTKAWITGLRREQSLSRKNTPFISPDEKFSNVKICPLIHWTWDDIQTYTALHKLPYNRLYDKGYPSIGCAPCTLPAQDAGDLRAGRWQGSIKTECGLHPAGREN